MSNTRGQKSVEGGGKNIVNSNGIFNSFYSQVKILLPYTYLMFTKNNPIAFFNVSKSPVINFYHGGGTLIYRLIHSDGRSEKCTLGCDIENGQQLQIVIPEGCLKSIELCNGSSFALISEAVFPGREEFPCEVVDGKILYSKFPHHSKWIELYGFHQDS